MTSNIENHPGLDLAFNRYAAAIYIDAADKMMLTPVEFRIFMRIVSKTIVNKIMFCHGSKQISKDCLVSELEATNAISLLIHCNMISRVEIADQIVYSPVKPDKWIAAESASILRDAVLNPTKATAKLEPKTDKFFGQSKSRYLETLHPNLVYDPSGETPWLKSTNNYREIRFDDNFVEFHARNLLDSQNSLPPNSYKRILPQNATIFDARKVFRLSLVKNPATAIPINWQTYQEYLEYQKQKNIPKSADDANSSTIEIDPMDSSFKLSLTEHKRLIAQRQSLGDEQFALLGVKEANYLEWMRKNKSQFRYILNEIKRNELI